MSPEEGSRKTVERLRRFLRARWESGDSGFFMKRTSRRRTPAVPAPTRPSTTPMTPAAAAPPEAAKPKATAKPSRHPSGILIPGESQKGAALLALYNRIKDCRRCSLGGGRMNFVFGTGNPQADIVFAGEAPGEQEDKQGLPFVGPAGQLLTRMLEAVGIMRDDVFICNVLKCRPPQNRPPADEEIELCVPYLFEQIEIISPKIVVALGRFAAQSLLQTQKPIGQLRGRVYRLGQSDLIATYHPSAILRNASNRPILEGDLKKVRELLEKPRGN